MSEIVCVAGTDTDAGKTFITAALAKAAMDTGKTVLIIKPVQTGCTANTDGGMHVPDIAVCREAAPGAVTRAMEIFEPACSPHLAAREAGRKLTVRTLAEAVRGAIKASEADCVIIEGAGGLFTPLNEEETLIDLFVYLGFPVLLVVGNKLGAVNHALLSVEACVSKGVRLTGFVTTEPSLATGEAEEHIRDDNAKIIAKLGNIPCLASIGYLAGMNGNTAMRAAAWEEAAKAVSPVLAALTDDKEDGNADGKNDEGEALLAFDRAHIWHPYTSALAPLHAWQAVQTRGMRITLQDGRELVDGMASWWCAIHGYNHPALIKAVHSQAGRMPHVMFGGITHEPAVALARRLLSLAPEALEHVFFADSGSVSVEVALKMALQYQIAAGKTAKKKILAVRGGYHGDTLGAMSVCDPENGMHHLFAGSLPARLFAPRPTCRFDEPYDPASFASFETELAENADTVAAVILEPVVQGAGGMWFYHPAFLRDVKAACQRHGVLLILDEVATGFGRTGKMFACEYAEIEPDIMCVGKGLTGGVMSLAATLATVEVAKGISRRGGVLMHGPTFMGNPLACAVAEKSLSLLADGIWVEDVARIEAKLQEGLLPCKNLPGVKDARVLGAIGVLEMEGNVNTEKLQQYFVREGVWIRPFARLIYVMPPYIASNEDVELLTRAMRGSVSEGLWR